MKTTHPMKRVGCLLAISLHLAACTTLNTVPYGSQAMAADAVKEGDRVTLSTKADGMRDLVVTSVTPERICGANECFPVDAIDSVTRKEVSVERTVGLALLIALGVGILAAIVHGVSGAGVIAYGAL